jgi:TP901 family phage tail tape measure protein
VAEENLGTARGKLLIDGSQARAELKRTASSAEDFRNKSERSGGAAAGAMKKAGKGVAIAAVGIAGAFLLAIGSAASFEKRISAIGAVTGASAEDLDNVRRKALQLGKDTKFSAGEAAEAIEELAKAGLSLPDIMNGAADATVNLAAAGEIDLPQAATIASNAMNQFGLAAKQLPAVADDIAGAANASAIDVSQFGQSISQVGAVANLAGLSFHDTAVAIAEMGNAGIKGSDAGTSLKTFLQNLIPTTKQQIDLSKKLGLITKEGTNAFFDQKGKVKGLADISQVLQRALAGMGEEQKLATLGILFGSDAIRAAAVLADQGAAGYDKMSKSMGKVKAADVAKKRMDNLAGSIEQMKGSAETLAIVIGESLQGAFRTVVDGATGFLNILISLAQKIPQFLESAKRLIKEGLEKLREAWNSDSIQRFVQAIARLVDVLKGPITSLLKGLVAPSKALALVVGGALKLAFDAVGVALDTAADAAEFVSRNWDTIAPIITTISVVFLPLIVVLVAQLGILGAAAIASAVKQVVAWGMSQAAAAKSLAVMIAVSTRLIVMWVLMGVRALVAGAMVVVSYTLQSGSAIKSAAIQLAAMASMIVRWIALGLAALRAGAQVALAWLLALGPIGIIIAAVIAAAILIVLFWDKIKAGAVAVLNWLKTNWPLLLAILTGPIGLAVLFLVKNWNKIVEGAKTMVVNVANWFRALPGRLLGAVGNLGTLLFNKGLDLLRGLLNGIRQAWNNVIEWFKGVPGQVGRAFSAAGTWLFSAGVAMIMGFIHGIESMAQRLAESAANAATAAVAGVKRLLHIGSPSRVFFDIGTDTMQGFINGVEKMSKKAIGAVTAMAATVPTAFTAQVSPGALPSGLVARPASGVPTPGASRTWSPTVVVNNAPPTTTTAQIQEGLRRAEALHSPLEALVG